MSGRESSLVPTNLQEWPACNGLALDQRLIFSTLWACRYVGCGGAGQIPAAPLAATLGVAQEVLDEAFLELGKRNLIAWDPETSEIFILSWYRFHKFKTPVALKILEGEIKKIASEKIRSAVLEKSIGCFPTSSSTSTSNLKKNGGRSRVSKFTPTTGEPAQPTPKSWEEIKAEFAAHKKNIRAALGQGGAK